MQIYENFVSIVSMNVTEMNSLLQAFMFACRVEKVEEMKGMLETKRKVNEQC